MRDWVERREGAPATGVKTAGHTDQRTISFSLLSVGLLLTLVLVRVFISRSTGSSNLKKIQFKRKWQAKAMAELVETADRSFGASSGS